jgi:hypothetical protein
LAGGLWGLATALKPYGFIFFPYFILKGMWRALLTGGVILCLAVITPGVFYGFQRNVEIHRQWASTLSESTPTLFTTADNVSIMAFVMKWSDNAQLSLWAYVSILIVLASLLLVVIVKGRLMTNATVLESAMLLTLIPLVSPLGWDYTFLLSVLGVTLIIHHFSEFSPVWRWTLAVNFCVIALTIYDVIGRAYYHTFMTWSVLTVNFLIVVGGLAVLRFKKVC